MHIFYLFPLLEDKLHEDTDLGFLLISLLQYLEGCLTYTSHAFVEWKKPLQKKNLEDRNSSKTKYTHTHYFGYILFSVQWWLRESRKQFFLERMNQKSIQRKGDSWSEFLEYSYVFSRQMKREGWVTVMSVKKNWQGNGVSEQVWNNLYF